MISSGYNDQVVGCMEYMYTYGIPFLAVKRCRRWRSWGGWSSTYFFGGELNGL